MKARLMEQPNPVLTREGNDYVDQCRFSFAVNKERIKIKPDYIVIPVSYELQCQCLSRLLEQKKAVVGVTVRSSTASYLYFEPFKPGKTAMNLRIPKHRAYNTIELVCTMIASKDISHFNGDGEWNPLYFNRVSFDLQKGDTLATSDRTIFSLALDEYEPVIGSIFEIGEIENQERNIAVDFNHDKIHVTLDRKTYDNYRLLKTAKGGAFGKTSIALILLPVLIETLSKLQCSYLNEEAEQYDGYDWKNVIEEKIDEYGISLDETADLSWCANILFSDMMNQSMEELITFMDNMDQIEEMEF